MALGFPSWPVGMSQKCQSEKSGRSNREVGFTPNSGGLAPRKPTLCAKSGRLHCRKPHYSITSPASAMSRAGISRPSVFAVLVLMTNPTLVGACTGNSAGFSPFRMRRT